MIRTEPAENSRIFFRLTALWVIAESGLGGLLHGLKLPVTGLLVGGSAMMCIMLISWYVPKPGSVLRAMMLVVLMKFSLSPHSPFPAYLAVFFQGVMGEFLLRGRRNFLLKCVFFGFLGMMESALQRMLVMLFISGFEIWDALDVWIHKVSSGLGPEQFSRWLATAYLLIHAMAGLFIGWLGWKIISMPPPALPDLGERHSGEFSGVGQKVKRKSKLAGPVTSLLAFLLWLLIANGYFFNLKGLSFLFPLVLRMIWVYGLMVYVLVPVLDVLFKKVLSGKEWSDAKGLEEVRLVLPEMLSIAGSVRVYCKKNRLGVRSFFLLLIFATLQSNEKGIDSERGEGAG